LNNVKKADFSTYKNIIAKYFIEEKGNKIEEILQTFVGIKGH
jgi:hypothetical protein